MFQSTYKAFENIDSLYDDPRPGGLGKVLNGHVRQSELVLLGLDGAIARDIKENIHSIYEGVHILPSRLKQPDWYTKPLRLRFVQSLIDFGVELLSLEDYDLHIIELFVDIDNPEQHKQRFIQREEYARKREAEKYLENFDNIRSIRDFMVGLARTSNIPIIQNNSLEEAVKQCIAEITRKTEGKFIPKQPK